MNIAICDDDSLELARISELLDGYRKKRNSYLTYKVFNSAVDLLTAMRDRQYDLLILDVLMPRFTGMQAAKEVRAFDNAIKIIFLTSSPEFAIESYQVHARDYILKPVLEDKLFSVLDSIFAEDEEIFDGISVKTQNGIVHLLFSKISFVEVMNKHLYFHLSNGAVKEVFAPLSKYENELLCKSQFVKVHRSYIVNLRQMAELTAIEFIDNNGKKIPISRLLYSEIRKAYMEQLFLEKGQLRISLEEQHPNK